MYHHRVFLPEDLGNAVRRARQDRGLTQSELAQRLGVNRMTVSRLEQGNDVNMTTALAALTECGMELVVVPKHARIKAADPDE